MTERDIMEELFKCYVCKRPQVTCVEHKGKSYIFECSFCNRKYLCNKSPKNLKVRVPKGQKTFENICNHCGMDKKIRNPSGFCDHLHYPENCDICKEEK